MPKQKIVIIGCISTMGNIYSCAAIEGTHPFLPKNIFAIT